MFNENVKFYLKDPKSDKKTSISARVQINGKPFKYGIKYNIPPDLWDSEHQRPTKDKAQIKRWATIDPGIKTILNNISIRQDNVTKLIVAYVNLKEQDGASFTHDELKSHLDKELGFSVPTNKPNKLLLPYFSDFVDRMESKKILQPNKSHYSEGTIKTYKTSVKKFDQYEKNRKNNLCFDDITMEFYDDFLEFCFQQNLSHNYIGNHIKHLKVVMEKAQEEGLHRNFDYRDKRFKILDEPSDAIYLSYDEIDRIKSLDLSDKPKLDKTRDIFLVCFFTAARISDAQNIDEKSLYEENGQTYLEIIVKKSNYQSKVHVPAKKELIQILNKYGLKVPRYAEQKVNENLKELGKMAGLTETVKVTERRAGQTIVKKLRKYQLITTHSARRSAATNMFKDGTPPSIIMKLTGHKTEKSFLKYIKVTEKESAKLLANEKFFKE